MDNRRECYRHVFPPPDRIPVELESLGGRSKLQGEIVNLSVSGLNARLEGRTPLVAGSQHLLVRFHLPESETCLVIRSLLKRTQCSCEGIHCGLQFLPLVNPSAENERAKVLSNLIMNLQRQALRSLRQESGPQSARLSIYNPTPE
jgi:hypothetical protein